MTLHTEVPSALDGERIDRVVSMLTGVSRKVAADLVGEGRITLDGTVVTDRSRRLVPGQDLDRKSTRLNSSH